MRRYRLSAAAQADIVDILARTEERFGRVARIRYQTLIVTAIRDIAEDPDRPGAPVRPELGIGARSWHFRVSRDRASGRSGPVRRPRHLIVFRIGKGASSRSVASFMMRWNWSAIDRQVAIGIE